jgi:hypothetical protein
MTDIEVKALALVRDCVGNEKWYNPITKISRETNLLHEALCRAIERHEAFKQEVSDEVEEWVDHIRKYIGEPQTDALKIARDALEPVGWVYTDREGETSLHGSRLENGPKLGWTEARLYILKEQSK